MSVGVFDISIFQHIKKKNMNIVEVIFENTNVDRDFQETNYVYLLGGSTNKKKKS